MPSATVDDVLRELGELPAGAILLIEELAPDREELIEARARLAGEEWFDRRPPGERVARLMRILQACEPEEEEP
jgi:hypothetical protein